MTLSTIQVSDATREQLKEYKVEGMSYEDVLKLLMQLVPPDEFHALYEKWQARVAREIRKSKKWGPLS